MRCEKEILEKKDTRDTEAAIFVNKNVGFPQLRACASFPFLWKLGITNQVVAISFFLAFQPPHYFQKIHAVCVCVCVNLKAKISTLQQLQWDCLDYM
jgi:hypothetical protein